VSAGVFAGDRASRLLRFNVAGVALPYGRVHSRDWAAARTEFVTLDLHGSAITLRPHHAPGSDKLQGAFPPQQRGPGNGQFHSAAQGQTVFGGEQEPSAAEIECFPRSSGLESLGMDYCILDVFSDRKTAGIPPVGRFSETCVRFLSAHFLGDFMHACSIIRIVTGRNNRLIVLFVHPNALVLFGKLTYCQA
jgi:hypothetical protein